MWHPCFESFSTLSRLRQGGEAPPPRGGEAAQGRGDKFGEGGMSHINRK